jgi:hypothetical protein
MPSRSEESRLNQRDAGGLLTCPVHNRLYRAEIGCQDCYLEKVKAKHAEAERVKLPGPDVRKCPECRKKSLFLNEVTGLWECVNRKTHKKRYYAQSEIGE